MFKNLEQGEMGEDLNKTKAPLFLVSKSKQKRQAARAQGEKTHPFYCFTRFFTLFDLRWKVGSLQNDVSKLPISTLLKNSALGHFFSLLCLETNLEKFSKWPRLLASALTLKI